MPQQIFYCLDKDRAEIALDDGKANTMDLGFFAELEAALDRAEEDGAKSVLFYVRERFFSAGLNLDTVNALTAEELPEFGSAFARAMLKVWGFAIPTVAATTGHAIAGGAILAFACDRRVALDGPYKIQMNESRNRMSLPTWAIEVCQSAIPRQLWSRALLHADVFTPREAASSGLFDECVAEGGDVVARGREIAESYRGIHLRSYAVSKRRLRGERIDQALSLIDTEHRRGGVPSR